MGSIEKATKDVRDLPLWLKWVGFFFGLLAIPGTAYTSITGYNAIVESISPQEIATSTVNISDLFYRLNHIERPIDQRTLLNNYTDTKVVGAGTFYSLGGSNEDKSYQAYISIRTGVFSKEYVACMFYGADDSTQKKLDLLKPGQEVKFIGTFSNSAIFGSNAWVIRDCAFLNE